MSAQRVRSDDAVPNQLAGVESVRALGLLEDAQVHVGLGHSLECRIHSPVPPVLDIVSTESNRHPLPRRTPGTPPRYPPTVIFSLPKPVGLIAPV